MRKRLYRGRTNKVIAGVCGGLGDYFDVDPAFIRVAFVLLAFANGIGLIAYIVLAIVTPREEAVEKPPTQVMREKVQEAGQAVSSLVGVAGTGEQAAQPPPVESTVPPPAEGARSRGRYLAGAVLVVLGVLFLIGNYGLTSWFHWARLWPILLIGAGVAIIWARGRR